jgi:hypothetical protein
MSRRDKYYLRNRRRAVSSSSACEFHSHGTPAVVDASLLRIAFAPNTRSRRCISRENSIQTEHSRPRCISRENLILPLGKPNLRKPPQGGFSSSTAGEMQSPANRSLTDQLALLIQIIAVMRVRDIGRHQVIQMRDVAPLL